MAWKGIVARSFPVGAFPGYVASLRWTGWRPAFLTVHNTAIPSLAQRPHGLTRANIAALENYYKNEKGWPAGPHLFIDDKQIWVFTALTTSGIHSPSWNGTAIGIEMLGDYARESFTAGRGLLVRRHTVVAMAALNRALGFKAEDFRFHVEDRRSSHNCPGINARNQRAELIAEIRREMEIQNADARSGHIPGSKRLPDTRDVEAVGGGTARAVWEAVKRWFWTH